MDRLPNRTFAQSLTRIASRRSALAAAGASAAALAIGTTRAQDATPEASEAQLLFVQVGRESTIAPNGDGTVTITITGVGTQTQYFSDRPVRIAGLIGTAEFSGQFAAAFADALPNASLVGMVEGHDEDLAMVVTLDQPTYDAATETLTYVATVLTEDLIDERTFETEVITEITEPLMLSEAALFIDSVNCLTTICL